MEKRTKPLGKRRRPLLMRGPALTHQEAARRGEQAAFDAKRNSIDVVATVDQLGVLAAEIAELTAKEKVLKDQLAALGKGAYEGTNYRSTVSIYDQRRLNMKAVRVKLTAQFIRANTKVKEVTKVVTKARVRDAAEAELKLPADYDPHADGPAYFALRGRG